MSAEPEMEIELEKLRAAKRKRDRERLARLDAYDAEWEREAPPDFEDVGNVGDDPQLRFWARVRGIEALEYRTVHYVSGSGGDFTFWSEPGRGRRPVYGPIDEARLRAAAARKKAEREAAERERLGAPGAVTPKEMRACSERGSERRRKRV